MSTRRPRSLLVLGLLLLAGALVLYQSARQASRLDIPPDEVEYALMAHRMATEGSPWIAIGGRDLPSIYPPWFSLVVLAPAYALLGPELGNAIFPVTLLALGGMALAFLLGFRVSGLWGGALAALGLLLLPEYRVLAQHVMSDVPSSVLLLGASASFVRMQASERISARQCLVAGILVALAFAIRPTAAAALVPFLLVLLHRRERRIGLLANLLAPLAAAIAATLAYDDWAFGTPFRNGYQLRMAVPCDYPGLVFSLEALGPNLEALWQSWLPVLLVLVVGSRFLRRAPAEAALERFLWIGTLPIVLFHLFYFYPAPRFFLASNVVAVVILGARLGRALARVPEALLIALLGAGCLGMAWLRAQWAPPPPQRRVVAERIRELVPEGALVISGLDAPYLEFFVARGSTRRVVPVSRRFEYADKLVTPRRVERPDPPPQSQSDHRCAGLLRAGAQETIPWVAADFGRLDAELAAGTRVYLDMSFVQEQEAGFMGELLRFCRPVERGPDLFELQRVRPWQAR